MKSFLYITFAIVVSHCWLLKADGKSTTSEHVYQGDTIRNNIDSIEARKIEDVINSPTPPSKDKVQYVSLVSKYGFRNLFRNYSYNSSLPYSSQVNPYAENYMQDYLESHKKFLRRLKENSMSYFNYIDGILSQYGLPKELKYLAVIESNLKSNALSVAGARGPWQFMSYTARGYGLRVNQYVDDRTDYYKSTNAAAKYLLTLYKDLKDWLLVIAAYNGGPGRVYSAIKKSGSRDFWKLQYYLPEESRNHVKKFIATHYIMESFDKNDDLEPANFDYASLAPKSDLQLDSDESSGDSSLILSGRYKASVIATKLEMDISEFNHYNPGFDNSLARGDSFNMRLPADKMQIFIENKYPILNECVEQLLGSLDENTKPADKLQKNSGMSSKKR